MLKMDLSRARIAVAALAVGLAFGAPLRAADWTDKLSIHAYGGWAVGSSDPYAYLSGSGEGEVEVDNVDVVMLFNFRPTDDVQIVLAPEWEIEQEDGVTEQSAKLELGSVEWSRSEKLRLRLGRNRLPFGIYTDIFDVGTLRPLFTLPQSIYGPTGFVSESYNGVGVGGLLVPAEGWELNYDFYVGGSDFKTDEIFEAAVENPGEGDAGEEAEAGIEKLVGARLTFGTPVEGLSVGFSAFAGEPESQGDFALEDPAWGDFASFGAHAELLRGPWSVRAEIGRHTEDEFTSRAGYLEIGRRFGPRWQAALRGESVHLDFDEELPPGADSLLDHDELVAGVSYWVTENFVIRLACHQIEGNLFAHPEADELTEALEEGTLDDSNRLISFGAQFSF